MKLRLRQKLLSESQVAQIQALQIPTLAELKQIINSRENSTQVVGGELRRSSSVA